MEGGEGRREKREGKKDKGEAEGEEEERKKERWREKRPYSPTCLQAAPPTPYLPGGTPSPVSRLHPHPLLPW